MRHQLKRGTAEQTQGLILPEGQMSAVTDLKQLRIHDGVTEGGVNPFGGLALQGPKLISAGEDVEFFITNFSSFNAYTVSVDHGTARLDGNTIIINVPATASFLTVSCNGKANIFEFTVTKPFRQGAVQLNDAPISFQRSTAIAVNNKVYIYSGNFYDRSGSLVREPAMWCYDTVVGTWEQKANGPSPIMLYGVGAYGNDIFYYAGQKGSNRTGSLYKYDTENDNWTQLADPGWLITSLTMGAANGKLVAHGGSGEDTRGIYDSFLNEYFLYDIATNRWQVGTSSFPRILHCAAGLDDNVYFFGGREGANFYNDLFSYNVSTGAWKTHAKGPQARCESAMVACQGKIYIFGGKDENNALLGDFWEYDPLSNQWQQLPTGATPRSRYCFAATDTSIYVMCGEGIDAVGQTNEDLFDVWAFK